MDTIATLPIDPLLKAALALTIPVLGYFVGAWLTAHQTQVSAATASIQDEHERSVAEQAVRWAEQAPDMLAKSGLEQRHAAVDLVAGRLGIPAALAEVITDAAFHRLQAAGQIQPTATATTLEPMTLQPITPPVQQVVITHRVEQVPAPITPPADSAPPALVLPTTVTPGEPTPPLASTPG